MPAQHATFAHTLVQGLRVVFVKPIVALCRACRCFGAWCAERREAPVTAHSRRAEKQRRKEMARQATSKSHTSA